MHHYHGVIASLILGFFALVAGILSLIELRAHRLAIQAQGEFMAMFADEYDKHIEQLH